MVKFYIKINRYPCIEARACDSARLRDPFPIAARGEITTKRFKSIIITRSRRRTLVGIMRDSGLDSIKIREVLWRYELRKYENGNTIPSKSAMDD